MLLLRGGKVLDRATVHRVVRVVDRFHAKKAISHRELLLARLLDRCCLYRLALLNCRLLERVKVLVEDRIEKRVARHNVA